MKRLLTLSVVAGLALAGCGESDDETTEARATTATTEAAKVKTAKEPSDEQIAKRGERSLQRSLDGNVPEPYSYELRGVEVSPSGWVTVKVSGTEPDEQTKMMARVVCGALISWFIDTDEKYGDYGYVELMDGTRLGECAIGKTEIK